jgi:hypothetical protein
VKILVLLAVVGVSGCTAAPAPPVVVVQPAEAALNAAQSAALAVAQWTPIASIGSYQFSLKSGCQRALNDRAVDVVTCIERVSRPDGTVFFNVLALDVAGCGGSNVLYVTGIGGIHSTPGESKIAAVQEANILCNVAHQLGASLRGS